MEGIDITLNQTTDISLFLAQGLQEVKKERGDSHGWVDNGSLFRFFHQGSPINPILKRRKLRHRKVR